MKHLRDLKPENILVDENLHLKITDFGSAKYLGELHDSKYEDTGERRRKNSFVGTAQFVTPEILNGKEPHIGTDLWSIGCVLFQMLTGKHLFTGRLFIQTFFLGLALSCINFHFLIHSHEYDIFQKVVRVEYSIPSTDFNTVAQDLISKLVVKEPSDRLGASEAQGYDKLKEHSFFNSIKWANLIEQTPPQ
jgi:3-phosphoinositide dependent protein kinase-1